MTATKLDPKRDTGRANEWAVYSWSPEGCWVLANIPFGECFFATEFEAAAEANRLAESGTKSAYQYLLPPSPEEIAENGRLAYLAGRRAGYKAGLRDATR